MSDDKYLLSSVSTALGILDLLSRHAELGVAEINKELGINRSSVFKMLYTLEKGGYLQKTANAKYKLGIKFAHYGAIVLERQDEVAIAKPFLQSLRDRFNETTHLAILDNDFNIIFIDKELSNSTIQMSSRIGAKLPAHCTANGKALLAGNLTPESEAVLRTLPLRRSNANTITDNEVLLAELKRIRAQGYAIDAEESEVGLTCYSAPLFNIHGTAIAAISISGPTKRMKQNKKALIAAVKEAAAQISKELGYRA